MTRLTRVMEALLRCLARLLPDDRRAWMRALRTEADEVPAGGADWPGWPAGYG